MGTSSISSSSYITQKNGNSYTTQSTVGITCDNMLLRITFSVARRVFVCLHNYSVLSTGITWIYKGYSNNES
jgi:hypothetical protein